MRIPSLDRKTTKTRMSTPRVLARNTAPAITPSSVHQVLADPLPASPRGQERAGANTLRRTLLVPLLFVLIPGLCVWHPTVAKEKTAPQVALAAQPDPVWPPPPDPARLKWVRFIRDEYDVGSVKESRFLDALAGKKKEIAGLSRPIIAAADSAGNVYVLDFEQGLLKFDFVGKKLSNLSSVGGFGNQNPVGLTLDSHFIYVTDSKTNAVGVLDYEGHLIRQIIDPKTINWPVGVAVDEKAGLLFVVNSHGHNVLVYEKDSGKLLRTIGRRGGGPVQFNFPTYIALLPGEKFAVVDSMNFRVQIIGYSGKFFGTFGKPGDSAGCFFRPKGIAADPDGHVYVADGAYENVQVFDQQGKLLLVFGNGGQGKGQFSLPVGLTFSGNRLFVADQMNRRLQVFEYFPDTTKGGDKEGQTSH